MSYAPSTKLTYSDGSATVLTGEMVMVTRGLGYGTMMKLADWLILADGREEIPLLVPPVQIAEGTKFKWVLGADTYRVAIQKKNGVLQVKSVTDGAGECHDDGCPCTPCAELRMVPPPPWRTRRPLKVTLFENYSAWLKSLPKGGQTTVTDPDKRSTIQKRAQISPTLSDVEKVRALQAQFKINSYAYGLHSPQQKTQQMLEYLKTVTYEQIELGYTGSQQEKDEGQRLLSAAQRCYRAQVEVLMGMTEEERHTTTHKFMQVGTGKLIAVCGNRMFRITAKYIRDEDKGDYIYRDDGRRFKTFAEMGLDTDDNSGLMAKYRNRIIVI
jgi:hypothetical protein